MDNNDGITEGPSVQTKNGAFYYSSGDKTENVRREMVAEINNSPSPKQMLEEKHGKGNVWDTTELQENFSVQGFMAPFCVVKRKSDGVRGTVQFQHNPRIYYGFQPE